MKARYHPRHRVHYAGIHMMALTRTVAQYGQFTTEKLQSNPGLAVDVVAVVVQHVAARLAPLLEVVGVAAGGGAVHGLPEWRRGDCRGAARAGHAAELGHVHVHRLAKYFFVICLSTSSLLNEHLLISCCFM